MAKVAVSPSMICHHKAAAVKAAASLFTSLVLVILEWNLPARMASRKLRKTRYVNYKEPRELKKKIIWLLYNNDCYKDNYEISK